MNSVTDPRLAHYNVSLHGLQPNAYQPGLGPPLEPDLDPANFEAYGLNSLANASVNSTHHHIPGSNGFAQTRSTTQLSLQSRSNLQPRSNVQGNLPTGGISALPNSSPPSHAQSYSTPSRVNWDVNGNGQNGHSQSPLYMQIQRLQQQERLAPSTPITESSLTANASKEDGGGHFPGEKIVPDPPNLAEWRERLFNVEGTITMTEDEFQTYFPHVDNVYSHRSTQTYKRKPFVSHYWDCRLKGRPPGTPKSEDPSKKKRKRNTRERDLCDVKIKITEYFPASQAQMGSASSPGSATADGSTLTFIMENQENEPPQPFGLLAPTSTLPAGHPGANGARYYTIQRVNGATGEKGDGASFLHKHTLEDSDKIKKNKVQRWLLAQEKEKKRQHQLSTQANKSTAPSSTPSLSPPFRSSGMALQTAKRHLAPVPSQITLYANSFCPFAQRVWIALEVKQIPYQFVEVPPKSSNPDSSRPPEMLKVNPDGVIPCITHRNWAVWESGIMMEYLEDLTTGHPLLPLGEPQLRAHSRLWTDHINRKILPAFYAMLLSPPPKATDPQNQPQQQPSSDPSASSNAAQSSSSTTSQHVLLANTLQNAITHLVNASHQTGPFFLGETMSFVDVAFAPWIIRLSRVLSHYRKFPRPEIGTRWQMWVDAIEGDERVRATVSEEGSYHSVYNTVGEGGKVGLEGKRKGMIEAEYAKKVVRAEGFGLGGDWWGRADEGGVSGLP